MVNVSPFAQIEFSKSVFKIEHLPPDAGHEVAFCGRSNSGKSSMLNALSQNPKIAKTSKTPGRTQSINVFDIKGFKNKRFMDLPGYGFAKVSKKTQKDWGILMHQYFSSRNSLRGIISIMDIRNPFKETDLQMIEWANHENIPIQIILNKSDKFSNNKKINGLNSAINYLDKNKLLGRVQTFSSKNKDGINELTETITGWLEM